jgi:endonuclease-3
MNNNQIKSVLKIVEEEVKKWKIPAIENLNKHHDPFKVLISSILSQRTKDKVTEEASRRLFSLADNPQKMSELSSSKIKKAIYPAGFYRKKTRVIKQISNILMEKYNGAVPHKMDELLELPGVGRKTVNLVLSVAYNKKAICVDTHVHRITNRWGYVNTETPYETEMFLRKKLPKQYWKKINKLLVSFGQNICKPVSPSCNICKISKYCLYYKKDFLDNG